jgi:hypothetical protein
MNAPQDKAPLNEDRVGFDPLPADRGFELYRHKKAEGMRTKNWHGYYWARRNEAGDYEIRSVPASTGEPSMKGGVLPKEGFEKHYEKAHP